MEFKKMCDLDSQGLYTLLFPNKHMLPMEEIEAFFSQFEGFNNVRAAGTEKGLRFARFKTAEGARLAFEALADHPTISLIPYINRKKNTNNNHQENWANKENVGSNNRSNSKKRDSSPSMWDAADKPQISEEKFSRRSSEDSPKLLNDGTPEKKVSSVSMRLMKYRDPAIIGEDTKLIEIDSTDDENTRCNELNVECSDNNLINGNDVAVEKTVAVDLHVESTVAIEVNGLDGVTATANQVNGFSEESNSQYSESNDTSDVDVPGLFVRAGEVVVGNIHPSFGPAYLLHLFEKYDPLAVSTIRNIKQQRSRYCHVYFKTHADATEVEKQFDKFDLMGRKLLVLQPKTLVDLTPC